jgi:hypothetical protein
MKRNERVNTWTILGIVAAAAVLAGVALSFGDLRRYIKVEMM